MEVLATAVGRPEASGSGPSGKGWEINTYLKFFAEVINNETVMFKIRQQIEVVTLIFAVLLVTGCLQS